MARWGLTADRGVEAVYAGEGRSNCGISICGAAAKWWTCFSAHSCSSWRSNSAHWSSVKSAVRSSNETRGGRVAGRSCARSPVVGLGQQTVHLLACWFQLSHPATLRRGERLLDQLSPRSVSRHRCQPPDRVRDLKRPLGLPPEFANVRSMPAILGGHGLRVVTASRFGFCQPFSDPFGPARTTV